MKKSIWVNLIISLTGVSLFILGNSVVNYVNQVDSLKLFPLRIGASFFIPTVLGVIISYPFNKSNKGTFDWSKLLIQGIPALILAIPLQHLLFSIMPVLGIQKLDLGIFNQLIMLQSQNLIFHAAFGVWLGKILAESIGSFKREKE